MIKQIPREVIPFATKSTPDDTLYKGETVVERAGRTGLAR